MLQHEQTSRTLPSVKETRHKRPPIVSFHWHGPSRKGKFIERAIRSVVSWAGVKKGIGCKGAGELFLGWWKCSKTGFLWWLCKSVNLLETTELYIKNAWILLYINYILLKLFFKKVRGRGSWAVWCSWWLPCGKAQRHGGLGESRWGQLPHGHKCLWG